MRVQMYTFSHDPHHEQSCMVRSASHGSDDAPWHIFAFGQVVRRRKDPLRPLITMFGHIHARVREMMRANEHIDPEFVFDEVLTAYNKQWKTLFSQSDVKYLLQSSYVIGVIKGNRMCIADRGMCVGKMVTHVDGRIAVIPVLTARSEAPLSPSLFESIVCGALPEQSRVILGTSQLNNIGRNDVFIQLLSKRTTPLDIIWQRMQQKLALAGDPAVAGVILAVTNESSVADAQTFVHQGFTEYMQSPPTSHTAALDYTRRVALIIFKRIGFIFSLFHTYTRLGFRFLNKRMPSWLRIPAPITHFFSRLCRACTQWSHMLMSHPTVRTIARSGRIFTLGLLRGLFLSLLWLGAHVSRPLKRFGRWSHESFTRLHVVQKISLIVASLAIIGIVGGVHITRARAEHARMLSAQNLLRDRFAEQFNIAESKLVFGNIPEAKQALTEAERALDALRASDVDVSALSQQLLAVRNELLKEKQIALSSIIYQSDTRSIISMTSVGDMVYAWHPDSVVTILNGRDIALPHVLGPSAVAARSDNGMVFIEDSTAASVNGVHDTVSIGAIDTSGLTGIRAAQRYSDRLYSLDMSGHIHRHGESSDGYGKGNVWSQQLVSQPLDLAIDGHAYVLSTDGSITKFFKGNRIPYDHSSIDPPLQSPRQLWTDADASYVYVLEPSRKRLVVLNKTGLMVVQYLFDLPITSFAIQEASRKGYVSVGSRVYTFDLTHLSP